jgi:AraC-like DNA-binding protein
MSEISHLPAAEKEAESYAAGDVIERHRHDDHQLIYVSRGVLAIRTEAGAWVAAHDRAVWVPAGVWHEHRFYGSSSFRTVGFPVSGAPLSDTWPRILVVDPLLRELLITYTDGDVPPEESGRIRGVLHDRLRRAAVEPLVLPAARDPRLRHACALAESNLHEPRPLAWLATQAHTSERVLARLFRSEFGMTYPQWRTNVRVFHAMVLLTQGHTVTETAHACGWATTSAFIDTFGRTLGQTPGAYRSGTTQTGTGSTRRPPT